MKYVLPLLMFLPFFSKAQTATPTRNFAETKAYIQEKVRCCSVDFTKSAFSKVSAVDISEDGTVTLHYLPEKGLTTFNLFTLYKESDSATGITLYGKSKFVQFHVSEQRTRLISFATHEEAKEVYAAFMDLLQLCKPAPKAFSDLNFQQTVDVVNIRLEKWSDGIKQTITALPNGQVIIALGNTNQTFRFNLLDLKGPIYKEGATIKNGIEAVTCTVGAVAPASWIYFQNGSQPIGFV
jgi:hypothetical protein